jgi:hypothetical protein
MRDASSGAYSRGMRSARVVAVVSCLAACSAVLGFERGRLGDEGAESGSIVDAGVDDASEQPDIAPAPQCSDAAPCSDQACINGTCRGVCTPGKLRCASNAVQTCEANGNWGTPVACVSSTCTNGKCTGSCSAGQVECSGNALIACDGGTWGDPVSCGNTTCCGAAFAKSCQGSCAPEQTRCSGNAVQTCGACGVWGTGVTCVSSTCYGAYPTVACTGECVDGQRKCVDSKHAATCRNGGQWVEQTCVNACQSGYCT